VIERLVLQVRLLAALVRGGHAPRRRTDTHTHTHTWVGHRELAREWRVEMITASGNKQATVVYFYTAPGRPI
jgi:hypothetical protein